MSELNQLKQAIKIMILTEGADTTLTLGGFLRAIELLEGKGPKEKS